jgi:hypothetical protein
MQTIHLEQLKDRWPGALFIQAHLYFRGMAVTHLQIEYARYLAFYVEVGGFSTD